jgi:hypothetical protein
MTEATETPADRAARLSAEGMTYAQVAEDFNLNRIEWEGRPIVWRRTQIENLQQHGSPTKIVAPWRPDGPASAAATVDVRTQDELLRQMSDDLAALRRESEIYKVARNGSMVDRSGPAPAQYRAVTMFWTRVVGWIMLVSAISSAVVAIWWVVEVKREDDRIQEAVASVSEPDYEPSAYVECMSDPDTSVAECELLDGAPD